jgi:hypothetical protein
LKKIAVRLAILGNIQFYHTSPRTLKVTLQNMPKCLLVSDNLLLENKTNNTFLIKTYLSTATLNKDCNEEEETIILR